MARSAASSTTLSESTIDEHRYNHRERSQYGQSSTQFPMPVWLGPEIQEVLRQRYGAHVRNRQQSGASRSSVFRRNREFRQQEIARDLLRLMRACVGFGRGSISGRS